MKIIREILLLTVMLVVSCSESEDLDKGSISVEDKFFSAIKGKSVLDSDGTTLTAKVIGDGLNLLDGDALKYVYVEAKDATQAIFGKVTGGFVGVTIIDGVASMYKNNQITTWDDEEDVEFIDIHKIVDANKGTFVNFAKGFHLLDSKNLELRDNGIIYDDDAIYYEYVENIDSRQAVYKKPASTDYIGIAVIENDNNKVYFYRPNGGATHFTTKEEVDFNDANKIDPLKDFKALIEGNYDKVYDIDDASELEEVALEINKDGNISKNTILLYSLESIQAGNKAVYSTIPVTEDTVATYIGFTFVVETGSIFLHREDRLTVWATEEVVIVDKTTRIDPKGFYTDALPVGDNVPVGTGLLIVKENGNIHTAEDVLKYEFVELHEDTSYGGIQTTNAIYKTTADNEFLGIQVVKAESKIFPYLLGKLHPWDTKDGVEFISDNKVPAPNTWDSVGTGLVQNTVHWSTAVIDDDNNLIVAYQDGGKLSMQRFNKATTEWEPLATQLHPAWGPVTAKDSEGNIWVSHEGDSRRLSVVKWDRDTDNWEDWGSDSDKFVAGADEGGGSSIAVDPNTQDVYVLHKKAKSSTDESSVRKLDKDTKTWEFVGPEKAIKGGGSKEIRITDSGELWVVSSYGANGIDNSGSVVVQKYSKTDGATDGTWTTVGGGDDGYIASGIAITMSINGDDVYIAYRNSEATIDVLKLNTARDGWDTIGDGISDKDRYPLITFYGDGTPILGTSGGENFWQAPFKALKYENGTWSKVGVGKASAGNAYHAGLAVDTDLDIIYAAYSDHELASKGLSVRQHQRLTTTP